MPVTTMGFGSGATHSYYQGGPWANLYSGSGTGPLAYTGGGLENPITPGPSKPAPSQNLGYAGIGTGLGNKPPAQPAPNPWYTPPNQSRVQQDLQQLISGWSINPQTGQTASPAQMLGKAGGTSLSDYLAHKGTLDPSSAQQALKQYQDLLASGKPLPNVNDPNWYANLQSGNYAPQGSNWANWAQGQPGIQSAGNIPYGLNANMPGGGTPAAPAASQQAQFDPASFALQDSINRAVNAMQTGQSVSNEDKSMIAKYGSNPLASQYLSHALGTPYLEPGAVQLGTGNAQVINSDVKPQLSQSQINQSLLAGSKNPEWWARTLAAQGKLTPPNP